MARRERALAGVALIAAPFLVLLGTLLHPPHVSASSWLDAAESDRTRFYLAHLAFIMALAVLVPAVLGLAELVGERDRALARFGRALALLGILGLGILTGTDLFLWQLVASGDHAVALEAVERVGSSIGVLGPTFLLAGGLLAGLAMLALGLDRAAVTGRWAALAIAGATPLSLLGFTLGWPAVTAALASAAGLGSVGWNLVSEPGDVAAAPALSPRT